MTRMVFEDWYAMVRIGESTKSILNRYEIDWQGVFAVPECNSELISHLIINLNEHRMKIEDFNE